MNLKKSILLGLSLGILSFACDDQETDTPADQTLIPQQMDQGSDQSIQDLGLDQALNDLLLPDMQMMVNQCLGGSIYGFQGTPQLLNLETPGPKSTPKVIYQEDGSFVMTWLAPSTLGTNQLWFQAFTADQVPIQEAIPLGLVRGGQQYVIKTSAGWMVAWMNELSSAFNQTGILLQKFNPSFALEGTPILVPNTVSVSQFAIDWQDEFAGMLVYATGLNGKDGFYAQAFDQMALVGQKQTITGNGAWLPNLKFGVESWGVAWLDPNQIQTGSQVFFALLNERGQISGSIKEIAAQAQASFEMTFASNLFALAWSKKDSTGNPMESTLGKLLIEFKVIDGDGNLSLENTFRLPSELEGDMILSDLSLIKPNIFGVTWQSKVAGKSVLGLHRVNLTNQVLDPVIWILDQANAFDLLVRGKNSELKAWMTWDSAPNPSGELSTLTGIAMGQLGTCSR